MVILRIVAVLTIIGIVWIMYEIVRANARPGDDWNGHD